MQLTFGDAGDLGKRKQTRREISWPRWSRWFPGSNCAC
ncbi:transposase [Xanthomonas oryzae pv. oryzicola]|nr:transposase [Xanthomonas oryzae pv. oryzicola]